MKSERDFYFSKLKDIDQIIDVYKDTSVENLIQAVKEILYLPPEKIAIITDEGNVRIKGKNGEEFGNCIAHKDLMNFNFLEEGDGAFNFDFEGGIGDGKLDLDEEYGS